MNYNFTDRTQKVLARAREEAVRLGHDYLGSEHILLGLVEDRQGVAMAALERLKVDRAEVRKRLAEAVPPGPEPIVRGELRYSPSGKQTLEGAMAESRALDHPYVGTEHLLLGLLRAQEGAGASVLKALGVTLEKARSAVAKLLRARHPTDLIEIDDESDVPIMDQIVERVRAMVARGALFPGTEMPEVRRLADRLDIAPGTVARAYAELERAGVLVSAGDGPRLVAGPREKPEHEDPDALATLLRPIVGLAHRMGVKADDLRAALARVMDEIYEARP